MARSTTMPMVTAMMAACIAWVDPAPAIKNIIEKQKDIRVVMLDSKRCVKSTRGRAALPSKPTAWVYGTSWKSDQDYHHRARM